MELLRDLLVGFQVHFRVINYTKLHSFCELGGFTAPPNSNKQILWKVLKRDDSCIHILQQKTEQTKLYVNFEFAEVSFVRMWMLIMNY